MDEWSGGLWDRFELWRDVGQGQAGLSTRAALSLTAALVFLAAALLVFALSVDDFIITLFNSGSTVTFPLQINGAFRSRFPPQINVLATTILIVSIALLIAGTLLANRRRRPLEGR